MIEWLQCPPARQAPSLALEADINRSWHDMTSAWRFLFHFVPKVRVGWGDCTIHPRTSKSPGGMEWAVWPARAASDLQAQNMILSASWGRGDPGTVLSSKPNPDNDPNPQTLHSPDQALAPGAPQKGGSALHSGNCSSAISSAHGRPSGWDSHSQKPPRGRLA